MSQDPGAGWGHLLMILLFCPSVVLLPTLFALRAVLRRPPLDARGQAGLTMHLVAILAVGLWYGSALLATANDVSAGGAYGFLGFIVLLPLNGVLGVVGTVLMLLEPSRNAPGTPPPLP